MGSRVFLDAADHHADFGAGGFADGPVDRDALPNAGDEFGGDGSGKCEVGMMKAETEAKNFLPSSFLLLPSEAAALGVGRQRLLQRIGQSEVIDDQPARLVAEHAVYTSDPRMAIAVGCPL